MDHVPALKKAFQRRQRTPLLENRRVAGDRVVQRQVLYLGEINDSQKAVWCRTIDVIGEDPPQPQQMAIFPEDRTPPALDCAVVQRAI